MKILHVVEPFSSGIITFIIHLTEKLPDHQHIVLHGRRVSQDEIESVRSRFPDHVKFIVWESAQREISLSSDFKSLLELKKCIRETQPDLVHLHSSKAGVLGRILGFFIHRRIIYTPNGASFLRQDISSFKQRIYSFIEWVASKLAGRVICSCRSEAEEFIKRSINATYINNGTNSFPVEKKEKEKVVVANFALITEQKYPKMFSDIAEAFTQKSEVEFWWVGDGNRQLIESSNVKILGWKSEEEVKNLYQFVDIYLSTSMWEGLPFSVLEAMNAECCLVLSDCVGHNDLVKNDINGYLIKDSEEGINRINELLNKKKRTTEFGKNSKQLMEKEFSAERCAKKYLKAYRLTHAKQN